MNEHRQWFAGIDWASEQHHARLIDAAGNTVAERAFKHDGTGLQELVDWLLKTTGAPASAILVAIEVPHGPIVELLLERGFSVHAINPKQLDRFRDRYTLAGAKDDSLDALVLASGLRTDPHCFRKIEASDPILIELREWSRIRDELKAERTRLTHRVREQLWRYFPAYIELADDLSDEWLLDLWQAVPTPAKAARVRQAIVAAILKRHRIRRVDAAQVLAILRREPLQLLPGTETAVVAHLNTLLPRLRLLNRQITQADDNLDRLIERLTETQEIAPGQLPEQRDVPIFLSSPGAGKVVLATLLAEAPQALRQRDYHALRCLSGQAPVTKRSGKVRYVVRRQAHNHRLANALFHWARNAIRCDPTSHRKYAALRARGLTHARALRSIGDRLLYVTCTMLRNGTPFRRSTGPETALAET